MSWQEILWSLPSELGWKWYALWGAFGLAAALIMFFKLIVDEPFSALLVSRVIFALGLVMIPLCALQPGYERWIVVPYAVGGLLSAVLIATDRCNRPDKSLTIGAAVWRWLCGAVRWFFGPKPWRREDLL